MDHHDTHKDYYARLKGRRTDIEARYCALTAASARLGRDAANVLPGGSTRDTVQRHPHALYLREGTGGRVRDADGRELVDLWFNATTLPLGHADPRITAAVSSRLAGGSSFYAPTGLEVDLARELLRRLPSADRVRFANSGTEAVMLAARMARAFTGRSVIAKFEGSYHGSWDDVAWSVGPSGAAMGPPDAPTPVAASGGLTDPAGRLLVLPYNDLDATARLLTRHGGSVAALFVEPIANRMGLVQARQGFLEGLRELCDRHGIMLVFDEVIAFRLDYHGAQGIAGVAPDLTTLGKLIGGGLPVGAVAGRADAMAVTEPGHPSRVTHAGTFTANPLTMAAGKATLDALTPDVFDRLNAEGARLRHDLRAAVEGLPLTVTGAGSLFKICATPREILDHRSSLDADPAWEELASLALLNEGYCLTPRLHGCVSTATSAADVDRFVESLARIARD